MAGAGHEKIAAVAEFRTSAHYTEAERAALELAEALTDTPPEIDDELYERVRSHFTEAQIVELAAMAAYENMRSRFNRVFRLEAQGLYCQVT